jgi:hypothetical protein
MLEMDDNEQPTNKSYTAAPGPALSPVAELSPPLDKLANRAAKGSRVNFAEE